MLALLACMSSVYAWDVTGNLAWPDTTGKNLTYTEVKDVTEIAITDVYSNTAFKQVKYWNPTGGDNGQGALTNEWSGFTPDVNVGNGGSWTLTFTIQNLHETDVMTLNSVTLQAVLFDSAGKFQPGGTPRNITFTLGVQGGETMGSTAKVLNGTGANTDAGRAENLNTVIINLENALEIAAKDSVTLTLTATRTNEGNGQGTFVGLKGASFQFIPEPTTATLSLLALAGLSVRRRRK